MSLTEATQLSVQHFYKDNSPQNIYVFEVGQFGNKIINCRFEDIQQIYNTKLD